MKKFLLLSIVAVFLFSCNKITESNIVGTWRVKTVKINGVDQTFTTNEDFVFTKDNTYNYDVNGQTFASGTYTVSKDDQTITLDGSQVISVSEKKSKSMKWNYTSGGDSYELTLEKQ